MNKLAGFTCVYTPLPLLDAAGYSPYRLLPLGNAPEQAGQLLHDNMCPHVKGVLDRALDSATPDLDAIVFMNSCDSMRRLFDAWRRARPDDKVILVDLPPVPGESSAEYLATGFNRLKSILEEWSGNPVSVDKIRESIERRNRLAGYVRRLEKLYREGAVARASTLQEIVNSAVTEPLESTLGNLARCLDEMEKEADSGDSGSGRRGFPVFLFGNVLPDPEVFDLLEGCGLRIAGNDLCTGSRMFRSFDPAGNEDPVRVLAEGMLSPPWCARTFDPARPSALADAVISAAGECGAKGVIGHTVKFCDPYLDRLPTIKEALRKAGLPVLILEGDCTLRSLGQHRTRIEAFAEMLV